MDAIQKQTAWDRQYAHEIAERIRGRPDHEVVEEIMGAFCLLRIQEADRRAAMNADQ